MKILDKTQIKQLKALAHKLKPIVTVGQHGMKESINDEIDIALNFHQLVKVKINLGELLFESFKDTPLLFRGFLSIY